MPDLVRVRHNGRESNMSLYFAKKRGAQVLNEPTHNLDGSPRPVIAASASGEDADGYDAWTVGQLRDEIADRNKTRAEDDQLVAGAGAKKADLVAVLDSDDETHAAGTVSAQNSEE